MDCARPAASSSGETVLERGNRANESDNVLADSPRVRLAALADMFELINKDTNH